MCVYCENLRPENAAHCNFCHRCVEKFDHHCNFVNNCLGYRNHKYFLIFLIFFVLYMFSIVVHAFNTFILFAQGLSGAFALVLEMYLLLVVALHAPMVGL